MNSNGCVYLPMYITSSIRHLFGLGGWEHSLLLSAHARKKMASAELGVVRLGISGFDKEFAD